MEAKNDMSEAELRQEIGNIRDMLTPMAADLAVIKQRLGDGDRRFSELQCQRHQQLMTDILVKVESLEPVKKLAYGAVGLSLTSIGGAIIMLVMKH